MKFIRFLPDLKFALLPILTALYPTIFLYANNVAILNISSLVNSLILYLAIGFVAYLIFLFINKFDPNKAALAASVFLLFFNIYGLAYNWLLKLNKIQIEHYTLWPLIFLIAVYSALLIVRLKASLLRSLWNGIVIILGALILFNLFTIVSAEFEKLKSAQVSSMTKSDPVSVNNKSYWTAKRLT